MNNNNEINSAELIAIAGLIVGFIVGMVVWIRERVYKNKKQ